LVALDAVLEDLEKVGPDLVVQGGDPVGMGPRHGDPRLSHLLIGDGSCTVRWIDYDVERAVADLEESGVLDAGWAATMYRTAAMPQLPA
jgi:hypothetical protein